MGVPDLLSVEPLEDGSASPRGRHGQWKGDKVAEAGQPLDEFLKGDPFEGCEDIAQEGLAEWVGDFAKRGPTAGPRGALAQDMSSRLPLSDCRRSEARCGGPLKGLGRVSLETGSTASRGEGSAAHSLWGESSCSSPSRPSRQSSALEHASLSSAPQDLAPGHLVARQLSVSLPLQAAGPRASGPEGRRCSLDGLAAQDGTARGCLGPGLMSAFPRAGKLPLETLAPTLRQMDTPRAGPGPVGFVSVDDAGGAELRAWRPPTDPAAVLACRHPGGRMERAEPCGAPGAREERPPLGHFLQSCLTPVSSSLGRR